MKNKERKMKIIKRIILASIPLSGLLAEETAAVINTGKLAGPLGAGMVVLGAAIGIGMFASAAARSIARQPEAAKDITGAVNLPLFLLEGVAIIALVVCLLATF
jgi:F-type H+-transporting ATPase subunit c